MYSRAAFWLKIADVIGPQDFFAGNYAAAFGEVTVEIVVVIYA